jgi:hypothetical protein
MRASADARQPNRTLTFRLDRDGKRAKGRSGRNCWDLAMQGPRPPRCGDVTLDPNQPPCPAATSPRARACSAAAVPTVNGRPWPDASTLGSRSASTSTDRFPAGQVQVVYHGGPVTRCWPSSTRRPSSGPRSGRRPRRAGPRLATQVGDVAGVPGRRHPRPVRQPWHVRLPLQWTHDLGDAVGGFDPLAGLVGSRRMEGPSPLVTMSPELDSHRRS